MEYHVVSPHQPPIRHHLLVPWRFFFANEKDLDRKEVGNVFSKKKVITGNIGVPNMLLSIQNHSESSSAIFGHSCTWVLSFLVLKAAGESTMIS